MMTSSSSRITGIRVTPMLLVLFLITFLLFGVQLTTSVLQNEERPQQGQREDDMPILQRQAEQRNFGPKIEVVEPPDWMGREAKLDTGETTMTSPQENLKPKHETMANDALNQQQQQPMTNEQIQAQAQKLSFASLPLQKMKLTASTLFLPLHNLLSRVAPFTRTMISTTIAVPAQMLALPVQVILDMFDRHDWADNLGNTARDSGDIVADMAGIVFTIENVLKTMVVIGAMVITLLLTPFRNVGLTVLIAGLAGALIGILVDLTQDTPIDLRSIIINVISSLILGAVSEAMVRGASRFGAQTTGGAITGISKEVVNAASVGRAVQAQDLIKGAVVGGLVGAATSTVSAPPKDNFTDTVKDSASAGATMEATRSVATQMLTKGALNPQSIVADTTLGAMQSGLGGAVTRAALKTAEGVQTTAGDEDSGTQQQDENVAPRMTSRKNALNEQIKRADMSKKTWADAAKMKPVVEQENPLHEDVHHIQRMKASPVGWGEGKRTGSESKG